MPIRTTCIGAYPKPEYVPVTDWFQVGHDVEDYVDKVSRVWERAQTAEARDLMDKATAEAVADQIGCGVDLPTDGEIRRENYVHYQCRHFDGFDFEGLTRRVLRSETAPMPVTCQPFARRSARAAKAFWCVTGRWPKRRPGGRSRSRCRAR